MLKKLCSPCQAKLDEDPITVLRRNTEYTYATHRWDVCRDCRRAIQENNYYAQSGFHNFTFENPNKTTQTTLCPSQSQTIASPSPTLGPTLSPTLGSQSQCPSASDFDFPEAQWFCKRCHSRVWATPRAFDGENEPEEWWWCNTCKKEKLEKKQKEKLERDKARSKALKLKQKREAAKASAHELRCYPKLDKWLRQ
jgi:hypothetical protein